MLTEGEASLHFCVEYLVNAKTNNQATRGVIIIDAVGGIIDLSMCSMKSNPISCEEIIPAECMQLLLTAESPPCSSLSFFRLTAGSGLCYLSG